MASKRRTRLSSQLAYETITYMSFNTSPKLENLCIENVKYYVGKKEPADFKQMSSGPLEETAKLLQSASPRGILGVLPTGTVPHLHRFLAARS